MNCSLAISPDLGIDAEEFLSAWNKDLASQDIARAKSAGSSPEEFIGLDPELMRQGMVFLAGIASTVALDIVKDLIKDRIKEILAGRGDSNAVPTFEVIAIQPCDKTIIVVKSKA